MKYLITIGHLGKDTGAVSPYDADGDSVALQEERYVNAQQVNGALAASLLTSLDVMFAAPLGHFNTLCDERIIETAERFSLSDRVELANDTGRMLIEFHNNSAAFNASGAEAIAWSRASAGYAIGAAIMAELAAGGIKNRGVKTCAELGRTLTILQKTRGPSLILEGGFLSSQRDMQGIDVDLDGFNETYGALVIRALVKYEEENS